MVQEVHPDHRGALASAWGDVIELHKMYKFVKDRLETEDEPVMWLVYWNMERTAVCIELYAKVENKVGFNCFMLVKELAHEFAKNPPWEDMFGELELDDDMKDHLIKSLEEVLQQE
jgi:hypothetical protein